MTVPTPQYQQLERVRRARKRSDVVAPNAWALLPAVAVARAVAAGAAAYLRARTALSPSGVWCGSVLAGAAAALAAQAAGAAAVRRWRAARGRAPAA